MIITSQLEVVLSWGNRGRSASDEAIFCQQDRYLSEYKISEDERVAAAPVKADFSARRGRQKKPHPAEWGACTKRLW